MAGKPYPLTTISGGINRLRTKGGADRNSLYELLNGYVTQANTVKVRPGTLRNANIATYSGVGNTKGLVAYQNQFHVFSDAVVPVPPGYALHVLGHPAATQLTAGVAGGDPYFNQVAALLPLAGTVGSTAITDASFINGAYASVGSGGNAAPFFTATNPIFGGNSLDIPTSATSSPSPTQASYVHTSINASSMLNVLKSTADFTVEFWFLDSTYLHTADPFCLMDGATELLGIHTYAPSNEVQCYAATGGGGSTTVDSFNLKGANTWNHIAMARVGGVLTLYVNGVAAVTTISALALLAATDLYIGISLIVSNTTDITQVSNFRVTAGLARYTANFVPPTVAFPTFLGAGANAYLLVPLKEIHFVAPFLGGLYVVAEFDAGSATNAQYGSIFHYWIQSSTASDNSNTWVASADHQIGDVVIPTAPNGLTYVASRRYPPNPLWTAATLEALNNVVEPNIANGFKYTVTAVQGANPSTGATEPTWPTTDGATVQEFSSVTNDQTFLNAAAAPAQPSSSVPSRYRGIYTFGGHS